MKKLMLVLTVAAFALASAAQAGEKSAKAKGTCDAAAKAACSVKTAATSACGDKSACCAGAAKVAKKSAPATARGTILASK